jgi:hypothetical protein
MSRELNIFFKMDTLISIFSVISIGLFIFSIYWMIQMLKLTKEKRILASMQIKLLQQYFKSKGVDIDLKKIQDETLKSM